MKLYHKSNPVYRNNILENGLIPSIGDSYRCHYEDNNHKDIKPAIFTCDDTTYDTTWDDDMWEIISSNIIWQEDELCYKGCFLTYHSIPIDCIKLIYKGTGVSTF